jgi:magnesium-transporting ATPase (P-type)
MSCAGANAWQWLIPIWSPATLFYLTRAAKVPADLRLSEMAGLRMEEAMLTGESVPVRKDTHPVGARQDCPLRSGQPGGCEPANRCADPGLAGRQIIASTRLQSLVIMVVLGS